MAGSYGARPFARLKVLISEETFALLFGRVA
jgi:hypothetical protein